MGYSLDGCRAKIERANEHIRDLDLAIQRFMDANPVQVDTSEEPETGDRIFRISRVSDPPIQVSLIAGDVIHNLRSALDHLAWQLVESGGGKPDSHTCFPISDGVGAFANKLHRALKGTTDQVVRLIKKIEPYKGGDGDDLWRIHKLDIIDKHRLLVSVSSIVEHNLRLSGVVANFRVPIALPVGYPGPGKTLDDGTMVYRDPARSLGLPTDPNPEFILAISFGEPDVFEDGWYISPTLHEFARRVEDITNQFDADHFPMV